MSKLFVIRGVKSWRVVLVYLVFGKNIVLKGFNGIIIWFYYILFLFKW